MDDKLDVKFNATESEQSNCLCNCCHGTGKALKLKIPETLYYNGKGLSTRYRDLWICETCREKLIAALHPARNKRAEQSTAKIEFPPAMHGRWDDSFDGITPYCTACGQSHKCLDRTPPYCPSCGAKMEAESQ